MKLENEKCSNAFVCAMRGVKDAIKTERNLKFDFIIAILVVIAGFAFRISPVEWLVCVITMGGMLFAELMNTAVEGVVDLYTREKNEQARRVKDVSAGAVFVLSIHALVVGLIIFIPKICGLIF